MKLQYAVKYPVTTHTLGYRVPCTDLHLHHLRTAGASVATQANITSPAISESLTVLASAPFVVYFVRLVTPGYKLVEHWGSEERLYCGLWNVCLARRGHVRNGTYMHAKMSRQQRLAPWSQRGAQGEGLG